MYSPINLIIDYIYLTKGVEKSKEVILIHELCLIIFGTTITKLQN